MRDPSPTTWEKERRHRIYRLATTHLAPSRHVIVASRMTARYAHVITMEPGKRGGRACVRGMRIAVADVLGWLAAGMSHQEILSDDQSWSKTTFARVSSMPIVSTG